MPDILYFLNSPSGSLSLVGLCLAAIIGLYFYNNPLHHGGAFMWRRFINWFPLGMTYAFLYMGRYNLNVSKNALGTLMTKEDFGIIFAVGTWTYALSFLVNGPLVDKLGGRKGILIAACGSAGANIALGVLTWLKLTGRANVNLVVAFSIIYALNMYFQSYGAVSIIKVKAYWFHVRERGVFGAIFGTLISFGVYFAFDWGALIVDFTKAGGTGELTWPHRLVQNLFATPGSGVDATWAVFFIPAAIMIFWAIVDALLIKDTPEDAGFPHLDTCDASSGQMHVDFTALELLKKVFASRLMLLVAGAEFATGVLRNGIYQWYPIFAKEVPQPGAEYFAKNWGLVLCLFGIVGGFAGGLMSDKWFQSRRGPPAALLFGFMLLLVGSMALFFKSPLVVGCACAFMALAVIGVHSLMSGTAAADFGGRKATATCSGIVDGFVYLGSGLQSVSLGFLTSRDWLWWPVFLLPFALLGVIFAARIWHELPAATKKYLADMETKAAH